MNMQPYQLIILVSYVALAIVFFNCSKSWVKIMVISIALILFFVNPVRFKQENSAVLERSISRFDDVPEKVEVKTESFDDFHTNQLKALKQESEERKDEVHN